MPQDIRTLNLFEDGKQGSAGGVAQGSIHVFDDIISLENLLKAWAEFVRGKRSRSDVQLFGLNLMNNIISLHTELKTKQYKHSSYHAFNISDPKPRHIHKASVRDRLLHHALYRVLYPYFDKRFIFDSYFCRLNKGTHKAMSRFRSFFYKVSKNNTKTCWVLKCDVRKFFASIDQDTLMNILKKHINDEDTLWLLERIIKSFNSGIEGKGLPLGNLTSQLLVNVYMNEFDRFVKHSLKVKYYVRYADDFVLLHENKDYLQHNLSYIVSYLREHLRLELHPDKVFIKTLSSGVDFLGWIHFPDHRVLRTVTKRRMLKKITENPSPETKASYLGLLKHGNAYKLKEDLKESLG